ncbi:MAG: TIGR04168 family protein [Spirulinaceae cyanobacterium]
MTESKPAIEIAVVGDIHDQWDPTDNAALVALGFDLVLFVGDFGNESIDVVRCISQVSLPFAAIMGNHDAWYTATPWGRKRSPYDPDQEDRVQTQLDLLGPAHVGYSKRDFAALQLSVVGGRPFSWGGPELKTPAFHHQRYGVTSMTDSGDRIWAAAQATAHNTLIFLSHNGPQGLGEQPESMCGRDWEPKGGDFGDPDLATAIARSHDQGKHIPLVTFGHMHHNLRHRNDRLRDIVVTDAWGTVYFNAASVPRIKAQQGETQRNFSRVRLVDGVVHTIELLWLNNQHQIVENQRLYRGSTF